MPPNSPTVDDAKIKLAMRLVDMEAHIMEFVDGLANAGFTDKRLCAIARTDIEKGFMALQKAMRMNANANNEYGKVPLPDDATLSRQRTGPETSISGKPAITNRPGLQMGGYSAGGSTGEDI